MKKIVFLLIVALLSSATAFASLTTIEFSNGDDLSAWSVDRAAPGSFSIVDNKLQMDITGPYSSNGTFYDTQGMKLDIGQSNYLAVDMYVDSAWTNSERYGGIWGVGRDSLNAISAYPILEYQGGAGIVPWDNSGWGTPSSLFVLDDFNRLEFLISTSGVEYFLNDTLVHLDSLSATQSFSEVILNAKYEGADFSVMYDNLTFGTVDMAPVPEPGTFLLLGAGLGGLALYRRKMKK